MEKEKNFHPEMRRKSEISPKEKQNEKQRNIPMKKGEKEEGEAKKKKDFDVRRN